MTYDINKSSYNSSLSSSSSLSNKDKLSSPISKKSNLIINTINKEIEFYISSVKDSNEKVKSQINYNYNLCYNTPNSLFINSNSSNSDGNSNNSNIYKETINKNLIPYEVLNVKSVGKEYIYNMKCYDINSIRNYNKKGQSAIQNLSNKSIIIKQIKNSDELLNDPQFLSVIVEFYERNTIIKERNKKTK